MNNNISFQSRINFVNSVNKYASQEHLNLGKLIRFDLDTPLYVKSTDFHTESIKTCTGGGFTDGVLKALGFHWLDDVENYIHLNNMCNCIFNVFKNENINGLIIGGKNIKSRNYSMATVNDVIDFFKKNVKHLSIFQEHLDSYGGTAYMYNLKNDTWTLSTGYVDKLGNYRPAQNLNDLKKCYRQIYIADNDTLCFNGVEVPKERVKAFMNTLLPR